MNKTIHELNSLTQAQADDEFIIYDVSENESKKIQVQNLNNPNYSTTEQKTGGTWVDGKPIYRKVINTTVSGVQGGIVTVATDFFSSAERLINGVVVCASPYENPNAYRCYRVSNNLNVICTISTGVSTMNADIIVEYTKTTD